MPSTAAEFYTSSRMGWAELDDEAIDSSITAGLLMNQLIVFENAIPGLNIGDEIGIFDANGLINYNSS